MAHFGLHRGRPALVDSWRARVPVVLWLIMLAFLLGGGYAGAVSERWPWFRKALVLAATIPTAGWWVLVHAVNRTIVWRDEGRLIREDGPLWWPDNEAFALGLADIAGFEVEHGRVAARLGDGEKKTLAHLPAGASVVELEAHLGLPVR